MTERDGYVARLSRPMYSTGPWRSNMVCRVSQFVGSRGGVSPVGCGALLWALDLELGKRPNRAQVCVSGGVISIPGDPPPAYPCEPRDTSTARTVKLESVVVRSTCEGAVGWYGYSTQSLLVAEVLS